MQFTTPNVFKITAYLVQETKTLSEKKKKKGKLSDQFI